MKLFLVALLLFPLNALADDKPAPIVIDMTTVLTDLSGKPIPDPTRPDCKDCQLTLGVAIEWALCSDTKETANDNATIKFRNCSLGERLHEDKTATLGGPQLAVVEDRIKMWPPQVVSRILPLIDPAQAEKAQKDGW